MRELPIETATLSGTALSDVWSQAVVLTKGQADELLLTYALVTTVRRTDSQDAAFFGRTLVTAINQVLDKPDLTPNDHIKQAIDSVVALLKEEKDGLGSSAVVIACVRQGSVVAAKIGHGTVGLFRDRSLQYVLPRGSSKALVSGPIKPADYLVIGTDAFFEHAYPTDKVFDTKHTPQQIVEILSPTLLALPNNADIAACLLFGAPEKASAAAVELPTMAALGQRPVPVQGLPPVVIPPRPVSVIPQKMRPTLYGIMRQKVDSLKTNRRAHLSVGPFKKMLGAAIVLLVVIALGAGGLFWYHANLAKHARTKATMPSNQPSATPAPGPQVLFDLTVFKEGIHAMRIKSTKQTLLVTDPTGPTVLTLHPQDTTGQIASGGAKLPNLITAFFTETGIVALTNDGIFQINPITGNTSELIKKDSLWGTIVDAEGYLGNVYLLDSTNNQIWKYTGAEGGYATIKNMLDDASKPNVQGAKTLAIDGVIWVITPQGITKISQGQSLAVELTGLAKPLGPTVRLATAIDVPNLYLLDTDNKRVVIAKKDGQFVSQIQSNDLNQVVDIAADPNGKQLYLLTPTKVLTLPMRP